MENKVAILAIIVEDPDAVDEMNNLLHSYGPYILGRMGIPHREQNLSLISIVVEAPQNTISALSGKLGMIKGISSKTVYAKTVE